MSQSGSEPEDGEIRDDNEEEGGLSDGIERGEYYCHIQGRNSMGYVKRREWNSSSGSRTLRGSRNKARGPAHHNRSQYSVSVESRGKRSFSQNHSNGRQQRGRRSHDASSSRNYSHPGSHRTATSTSSRYGERSASRSSELSPTSPVSNVATSESGTVKRKKRNATAKSSNHSSRKKHKGVNRNCHDIQRHRDKGATLKTSSRALDTFGNENGRMSQSGNDRGVVSVAPGAVSASASMPEHQSAPKAVVGLHDDMVEDVSDDSVSVVSIAVVRKTPEIITLDVTDTSEDEEEEETHENVTNDINPDAESIDVQAQINDKNDAVDSHENCQSLLQVDIAQSFYVSNSIPNVGTSHENDPVQNQPDASKSNDQVNQNEALKVRANDDGNESEDDIEVLELRNKLLAGLVEKFKAAEDSDPSIEQPSSRKVIKNKGEDNITVIAIQNEKSSSIPSSVTATSRNSESEEEDILLRQVLLSQMQNRKREGDSSKSPNNQESYSNSPSSIPPPSSPSPTYNAEEPFEKNLTERRRALSQENRRSPVRTRSSARKSVSDEVVRSNRGRRAKNRNRDRRRSGNDAAKWAQSSSRTVSFTSDAHDNLPAVHTRMVRLTDEPLRSSSSSVGYPKDLSSLPEGDLRVRLMRNASKRRANSNNATVTTTTATILSPQHSPASLDTRSNVSHSSSCEFREFGLVDTDLRVDAARLRNRSGGATHETIVRTVNFNRESVSNCDVSSSPRVTDPVTVEIPMGIGIPSQHQHHQPQLLLGHSFQPLIAPQQPPQLSPFGDNIHRPFPLVPTASTISPGRVSSAPGFLPPQQQGMSSQQYLNIQLTNQMYRPTQQQMMGQVSPHYTNPSHVRSAPPSSMYAEPVGNILSPGIQTNSQMPVISGPGYQDHRTDGVAKDVDQRQTPGIMPHQLFGQSPMNLQMGNFSGVPIMQVGSVPMTSANYNMNQQQPYYSPLGSQNVPTTLHSPIHHLPVSSHGGILSSFGMPIQQQRVDSPFQSCSAHHPISVTPYQQPFNHSHIGNLPSGPSHAEAPPEPEFFGDCLGVQTPPYNDSFTNNNSSRPESPDYGNPIPIPSVPFAIYDPGNYSTPPSRPSSPHIDANCSICPPSFLNRRSEYERLMMIRTMAFSSPETIVVSSTASSVIDVTPSRQTPVVSPTEQDGVNAWSLDSRAQIPTNRPFGGAKRKRNGGRSRRGVRRNNQDNKTKANQGDARFQSLKPLKKSPLSSTVSIRDGSSTSATVPASSLITTPASQVVTTTVSPSVSTPVSAVVTVPISAIVTAPAVSLVTAHASPIVKAPVSPLVSAPASPIVKAPVSPLVSAPASPIVKAPVSPLVSAPASPLVAAPASLLVPVIKSSPKTPTVTPSKPAAAASSATTIEMTASSTQDMYPESTTVDAGSITMDAGSITTDAGSITMAPENTKLVKSSPSLTSVSSAGNASVKSSPSVTSLSSASNAPSRDSSPPTRVATSKGTSTTLPTQQMVKANAQPKPVQSTGSQKGSKVVPSSQLPPSNPLKRNLLPQAQRWCPIPQKKSVERIVIPVRDNDTSTSEEEDDNVDPVFQRSLDVFLKKARDAVEKRLAEQSNSAPASSKFPDTKVSPNSATHWVTNVSSSITNASNSDEGLGDTSRVNVSEHSTEDSAKTKEKPKGGVETAGGAENVKPIKNQPDQSPARPSVVVPKGNSTPKVSIAKSSPSVAKVTDSASKATPQSLGKTPASLQKKSVLSSSPNAKQKSNEVRTVAAAIATSQAIPQSPGASNAAAKTPLTPTNQNVESQKVTLANKTNGSSMPVASTSTAASSPANSKTRPSKNSTVTTPNSNNTPSNNEDGTSSKTIIDELMKKITESRDQLALSGAEKTLIRSRQKCLEEIRGIKASMEQHLHFVNLESNCQNEIDQLKKKLNLLKSRKEILSKKATEINNTIVAKTKKVLPGRARCIKISRAVKSLGGRIIGDKYKVPDIFLKDISESLKELDRLHTREPPRYQMERGEEFRHLIGKATMKLTATKVTTSTVPSLAIATTSMAAKAKPVAQAGSSKGGTNNNISKSNTNTTPVAAGVKPAMAVLRPKNCDPANPDAGPSSTVIQSGDGENEKAKAVTKPAPGNSMSSLKKTDFLTKDALIEADGDEDGNHASVLFVLDVDLATTQTIASLMSRTVEDSLECLNQTGGRILDPNKQLCPDWLQHGVCQDLEHCPFQHDCINLN